VARWRGCGQYWYYVAYVGFSAAGLAFHGYFYCFHLLHVAKDNDMLGRVLQAVTKNGQSLLWVALLTVIIIYIYSLIAYTFYSSGYASANLVCNSLFECLVTTLNFGPSHKWTASPHVHAGACVPVCLCASFCLPAFACTSVCVHMLMPVCVWAGLRAGGGVGDILSVTIPINQTDERWAYLGPRAIYDLLFFIMVRVSINPPCLIDRLGDTHDAARGFGGHAYTCLGATCVLSLSY
jgi:hypothetical protein